MFEEVFRLFLPCEVLSRILWSHCNCDFGFRSVLMVVIDNTYIHNFRGCFIIVYLGSLRNFLVYGTGLP